MASRRVLQQESNIKSQRKKLYSLRRTYCPICDKIQQCDKLLVTVKQRRFKQGKDDTFALVFCNSCHMCLQYPTITREIIQKYYSSGYNLSNYQNDLETTFQTMKGLSEYRFNFICQKIGSVPKFCLEIGPGVGTLMNRFQQSGSVVVGVEADTIAAEWMKVEKRLNIYNCFFDDFVKNDAYSKYSKQFDLVIISHVLEHIPRPLEILREVKSLMNPKSGFLFIEVPNVLKPYSDGKRWQDHCDPGHIYYYSPGTLQYLLERSGYQVVSMVTDEFPPHFPIFCLARYGLDPYRERIELNIKNDIHQIRRNWLRLKLKHYIYYYPRRLVGSYLRQVKWLS